MDHYIQKGGAFDQACDSLLSKQYQLSWLDRFPPYLPSKTDSGAPSEAEQDYLDDGQPDVGHDDEEDEEQVSPYVQLPTETVNKTNRHKYRCPVCESQAWGKPGLQLICGGEGCDKARFNVV